jgi:DNA (cytosine-5)-methyltransferase 1
MSDYKLVVVDLFCGGGGFSTGLVNYTGETADPEAPLPTVTTTETLALCIPECYPWGLDVRYRMLKPIELARAQGFPDDYEFAASTKRTHTELIGNAVPVGLAEALCETLLDPTDSPILNNYAEGPHPAAEGGASDDD